MTITDDLHPRFGLGEDPDGLREISQDDETGMPGATKCKVEGCDNPADAKLGPYGGLCVMHANEKKAARKKRSPKAGNKIQKPKEPPTPIEVSLADGERCRKAMDLLTDLVLLDDSDLDLDGIRLEAARIVLSR